MIDLKNFNQTIQQIAEEKGISKDKVLETIEMALAAAYKRDYGKKGQIIRAKFDSESGKVNVTQIKIVVDESMLKSEEEIVAEEKAREEAFAEKLAGKKRYDEEYEAPEATGSQEEDKRVRFNPEKHIMIEEAKKTKKDIKPGDELEFKLEFREEYGRIAAQTAKQVIIQRIREAEREAVFEEYKNKEGELISGLVQRIEGRNVFIDIGRTVGVLPQEEQIPGERYRIGDRVKALVVLVEKNPKGPGIFLSRSHPRLLRKLFELEVPEIASGAVEIKAVAREAGSRTKIAVFSKEQGVDPVGSLVGQKGIRVITVIQELGGEKIDIIEWSEDSAKFIGSAIAPAKVTDVVVSEERKEARVMVPEDQLSLAIGKGGQNVRLAAKLTGWKIDVRSNTPAAPVAAASQGEEIKEEAKETIKEEKTEEKPAKKSKKVTKSKKK